jgi:uncharacterized protein
VNDYGGLLAPAERERLEALLTERERATGAQMVLAVFRSLEGENLEDFSIRLAERWRVGQKTLDNGVILLVFVDDRKMRLEVGYGLEGAIPDAAAGQIIRDTIAPRFREGRYAAGLEGAIRAVFDRIDSTPEPQRARRQPSGGGLRISPVTLLILFGVVAFIALAQLRRRPRGRLAGYTAGRRGWSAPLIVPPIWWGGGGGWGGRGGGSGGGGFSSGGGSFGGGGASGSW